MSSKGLQARAPIAPDTEPSVQKTKFRETVQKHHSEMNCLFCSEKKEREEIMKERRSEIPAMSLFQMGGEF
jgi:hypothetical protein